MIKRICEHFKILEENGTFLKSGYYHDGENVDENGDLHLELTEQEKEYFDVDLYDSLNKGLPMREMVRKAVVCGLCANPKYSTRDVADLLNNSIDNGILIREELEELGYDHLICAQDRYEYPHYPLSGVQYDLEELENPLTRFLLSLDFALPHDDHGCMATYERLREEMEAEERRAKERKLVDRIGYLVSEIYHSDGMPGENIEKDKSKKKPRSILRMLEEIYDAPGMPGSAVAWKAIADDRFSDLLKKDTSLIAPK